MDIDVTAQAKPPLRILAVLGSQTLQDVAERLDTAFQRFFQRQGGFPRFKKVRKYRSFTLKQSGWKLLDSDGKRYVPFVSIRPPGFIDQVLSKEDIAKGRIMAPFAADAKASIILADDIARYLAMSVDVPEAVGQRIPVAAETPISFGEIAATLSRLSSRSIRLQSPPAWMIKLALPVMGRSPGKRTAGPIRIARVHGSQRTYLPRGSAP